MCPQYICRSSHHTPGLPNVLTKTNTMMGESTDDRLEPGWKKPMKPTLVMVVDDEAHIVRQIAEALRAAGYDVVAAASAEQALERIANARHAAALVTDIRLPGMSGWKLAREVRRRFPRIAIIHMSGYSAAQRSSEGVPNSVMLDKPFVAAQLLAAAMSLLERTASATAAAGTMPDMPRASQT